jgi:hypothetical protein
MLSDLTQSDADNDDAPPDETIGPPGEADLQTWVAIREQLSLRMTTATYELHFLPARVISRNNGTLLVGVRPTSLDWVTLRLRDVVDRAVAAVEPSLRIEFVQREGGENK